MEGRLLDWRKMKNVTKIKHGINMITNLATGQKASDDESTPMLKTSFAYSAAKVSLIRPKLGLPFSEKSDCVVGHPGYSDTFSNLQGCH